MGSGDSDPKEEGGEEGVDGDDGDDGGVVEASRAGAPTDRRKLSGEEDPEAENSTPLSLGKRPASGLIDRSVSSSESKTKLRGSCSSGSSRSSVEILKSNTPRIDP